MDVEYLEIERYGDERGVVVGRILMEKGIVRLCY